MSNAPSIPPNETWCEQFLGNKVKLEFPDETYVVSVQQLAEDVETDGESVMFESDGGNAP